MNSTPHLQIFISCAPGLETVLTGELEALKITSQGKSKKTGFDFSGSEEKGGIELDATLAEIYQANLSLRTASRIVIRLGEFHASAFSELRKKASRLEWEDYITPGENVLIKVTCHKSRLYHSDAVAERVLGAINDHFQKTSTRQCGMLKNKPGQLVLVRLVNDMCTISIDSSGELLHRRGYRQAVAKAPLRETLAAGILLQSGWVPGQPLIDPFCGSGTIPIEAGLIAASIAPGINRPFAFMNWPSFDKDRWQSLLKEAQGKIRSVEVLPIQGFDRDEGAVTSARANAARAGLKTQLQFNQQAISYLQPASQPGWIITNPPYGVRINENKDLRDLYARFGEILRSSFSSWNVAVLCSDDVLVRNLSLGQPHYTYPLVNGGIPVKFSIFDEIK